MNAESYSGWALLPDPSKIRRDTWSVELAAAIGHCMAEDGDELTAKRLRHYAEALDGKPA